MAWEFYELLWPKPPFNEEYEYENDTMPVAFNSTRIITFQFAELPIKQTPLHW